MLSNGTHEYRALVAWLRSHNDTTTSPLAPRRKAARLVKRAVKMLADGYTWQEVYADFVEQLPPADCSKGEVMVSLRTLQRYVASISGGPKM